MSHTVVEVVFAVFALLLLFSPCERAKRTDELSSDESASDSGDECVRVFSNLFND